MAPTKMRVELRGKMYEIPKAKRFKEFCMLKMCSNCDRSQLCILIFDTSKPKYMMPKKINENIQKFLKWKDLKIINK